MLLNIVAFAAITAVTTDWCVTKVKKARKKHNENINNITLRLK